MKLALGTAQFGLHYGIANTTGKPPTSEVARILQSARQAGMDTLDTAAAYGDSETILGEIGLSGWKVVTKVPRWNDASENGRQWVVNHVRRSLSALRIERLDAILLHDAFDLLRDEGDEIAEALHQLKAEGLVAKIGYSIYSPDALTDLLHVMKPDLIQAPFNVLDQRIRKSGWLPRLTDAGVEVHARSAFLQGLLLMERKSRPAYFSRWERFWQRWHIWLVESGMTPLQACLGFISATTAIDRIVVGVDGRVQLAEILQATSQPTTAIPDDFACDDLDLIDPSRWPR